MLKITCPFGTCTNEKSEQEFIKYKITMISTINKFKVKG